MKLSEADSRSYKQTTKVRSSFSQSNACISTSGRIPLGHISNNMAYTDMCVPTLSSKHRQNIYKHQWMEQPDETPVWNLARHDIMR